MYSERIESLEQMLEMAEKEIAETTVSWWVYGAFTDGLFLRCWKIGTDFSEMFREKSSRLLELHIFSELAEYRAYRGDIGKAFQCRRRSDETSEYFDETQYLDIDLKSAEKVPDGWRVRTTGGGIYIVPLEKLNGAGVVIRSYVSYYEESGQAYISDTRIVRLEEGV